MDLLDVDVERYLDVKERLVMRKDVEDGSGGRMLRSSTRNKG